MSKRKISERNLLIEQCLHDAYCEENNIINEGVWDNIKAGAAGAMGGAWNALKTDAKNSFRLKSRDELKADAKNAYNSGRDAAKIKSYAKSLSKTMQDFINAGGKLGTNIDDENDVVERLKRVTQGLNPGFDSRMRKKAETTDRREQAELRRQGRAQNTNNQKTPQPQQTPQTPQSPTTATDPRYNNQKTDNQGAADETPETEKQSVQPTDQNNQPTSQTPVTNAQSNNTDEQAPPVNSDGQTTMLNSIPNTTSKRTKEERLAGIQNARKIRKQAEQEKAKRDKARRIRRGEEKSTIAKVGDGIKNLFTRKKSKGQNSKIPKQPSQQPQGPPQTPPTAETNNQDNNGDEKTAIQTSPPAQNNNPPSAKQLPPPKQKQKGSNVNFDYQTDTVTGGTGDTMSGVAYDGYTQPAPAKTPNNALAAPNNTLSAPNNDQENEEKQRKDIEDTMEQMRKFSKQNANYGSEGEERPVKKKRKKITESFKNTSAQITMLNSIK